MTPLLLLLLAACGDDGASAESCDGPDCGCGDGTWGYLADDAAVFVAADAEEGGDGSEDHPFRDVQEAVDAAGAGLVALAEGRYAAALTLDERHDGLVLAGRCADLVVIDGAGADDLVPTLRLAGEADVQVYGVTVTGGRRRGVDVNAGALTLERSAVVENVRSGIRVGEPDEGDAGDVERALVLRNVEVSRNLPETEGDEAGLYGYGAYFGGDATVLGEDLSFVGNTLYGISVADGAEVELHRVSIEETQPDPDGFGRGMTVSGGQVVAEDLGVRSVTSAGITAVAGEDDEEETSLELDGLAVSDVTSVTERGAGHCVATSGASVALRSAELSGCLQVGLFVELAWSLVLEDVAIRGVTPSAQNSWGALVRDSFLATADGLVIEGVAADADATNGAGLGVSNAGVSITDLELSDVAHFGLAAMGPDAVVVVDGFSVTDVPSVDVGLRMATGVLADTGASLTLSNGTITRAQGLGLGVTGNAHATVTSVVIAETRADSYLSGFGLEVAEGGSITAVDVEVIDAVGMGVLVQGTDEPGTPSTFDGLVVDGVVEDGSGVAYGLLVSAGATVDVTGATIEDVRGMGVLASAEGTTLTVDTMVLREVRRPWLLATAPAFAVQRAATADVTALQIEDSDGAGLYVASTGWARCAGCTLRRTGFAGAAVFDGSLELVEGCVIEDVEPEDNYGGGVGVWAWDYQGAPSLLVQDSSIGPQIYAAAWLWGAGTYTFVGNELSGGEGWSTPQGHLLHGNAVYAADGVTPWDEAAGTGLLLQDNDLFGAAGTAVLLSSASATLQGNRYADNALDLAQQYCESDTATVVSTDESPTADLCGAAELTVDLDYAAFSLEPGAAD